MKRPPYDLKPSTEAVLRSVAIRLGTWNVVTLQLQAGTNVFAAKRAVDIWKEAALIRPDGRRVGDLLRWVWIGEPTVEDQKAGATFAERQRAGGTKHGNLWRAMTLLKEFCPTDLMAMSCTDLVPVSLKDAHIYCQLLLKAEYLRVQQKAVPGRREASYRLIRNTGPLPPMERRVRAVIDQNEGKVTYLSGGIA